MHKIRKKRKRNVLISVVSLLIVFVMAFGMLQSSNTVYAAAAASDNDTRNSYSSSLGDSSSTRYNGRIWTDKSVSSENQLTFSGDAGQQTTINKADGEDFLVTYSLLGTSTRENGSTNAPLDVVLIIDDSGSMNNSGYLDDTVQAVNNSIATLMEMNENNRVAVVLYGSSSQVLLPLGHYTPSNESGTDGTYVNYTNSGRYFYNTVKENVEYNNPDIIQHGGGWLPTWEEIDTDDCLDMSSSRGTNIQMGIYTGMNLLASNDDTTVNVNGTVVNRVPAVILLSDGAATYSSSSQNWWQPSNNQRQGPGSSSYYGNGMLAMATAQYMKQQINDAYADGDSSSPYAAKVYTVGMGISSLSGDDSELAYITLDPSNKSGRNTWDNDMGSSIENAFYTYTNGRRDNTPDILVNRSNRGNVYYEMTHPASGDISTLNYNDGYYGADQAGDVVGVFDEIMNQISVSVPQVPTKVGEDEDTSGYVTYTDPIGEYMEVKDVKTILYSGVRFDRTEEPQVSADGKTTTYRFEGQITSPVYGEKDVSLIEITVTEDDNGNQTLTVKVPASAIPVRVNTITLDSNGKVTGNVSNGAYPLRVIYSVGLKEKIDPDTLDGVSADYIAENTSKDSSGNNVVNFYSNLYSGKTQGEDDSKKTVGDASVTFTPADTNPYYFVQEDTPLYTDVSGKNQASSFEENETYYLPVTYYNGESIVTEYVARSGETLSGYVKYGENGIYIEAGAPRLGNLEDFVADKASNPTNTASTSRYPTFEGSDVHSGAFTVYLGNNGLLQLDAPATLTIEKQVTAGEKLTAPDAEFTFQVTIPDKAGKTIQAVKHTTTTDFDGVESVADENVTLRFDENGAAQVVTGESGSETLSDIALKANESLEIPGMTNTGYTVKEINIPAGFSLTDASFSQENTGSFNKGDSSANGTIADKDLTITFTNHYSVTPITSEDLHITLGGSKAISGRDFQNGDSFTFTISAAQATPKAPLPKDSAGQDVTSVTITPTSGQEAEFAFDGKITFTEPGEYRYIIQESQGSLPGVDYDSAIYRLNIVIADNGDGTLRLAAVDEITNTAGNLEYPSNPYVQEYSDGSFTDAADNSIAFENGYSADDAQAVITGLKKLNVTNSDRNLADDEFTFTIKGLGYNTDGSDTFGQSDEKQPMPGTTQANNIANGNVSFGSMTFTQEMVGRTYGYSICEDIPGDAVNPSVNGGNTKYADAGAEQKAQSGWSLNGITYDSAEKIVKVTVGDDGAGHVTATVSPNEGSQESPANFTFTNSYEPESITIGDGTQAGIDVQKTYSAPAWMDEGTFSFEIENTQKPDDVTAPMPADTDVDITASADKTVATETFGAMTFEQEGTYVYEIRENKGDNSGIAYDSHVVTVTVTVTENESNGTLSASIAYDNSHGITAADREVTNAAAFTNTYSASFNTDTSVDLNGTKNLKVGGNSNRQLSEADFYFDVIPVGDTPDEEWTVPNAAGTAENPLSGNITLFKDLQYQLSDLGGAQYKDFVYIVTEQQGNKTGVTYDTTAYRVTIRVTDDGKGIVSAADPKIEKGSWNADDQTFTPAENGADTTEIVFNNSYTPESYAYTPANIKKVLDGNRKQNLQADEFDFKMSIVSADPSDGIALPADTTVSNDADGNVTFGNITFSKVGTYVVKVEEIVPEDATDNGDGTYTLNGITYDTNVLQTTFTVSEKDGKLTAAMNSTGSRTFNNEYQTTGTLEGSTDLEITKVLTGRDWINTDSFTFTLAAADEATSQAVENGNVKLPDNASSLPIGADTEGHKAAFGDITFNAEGTYVFVISENTESNLGGMTYAAPRYIHVTTTDNGDGTLTVTSFVSDAVDDTTGDADLTFTNVYTPGQTTLNGAENLHVTKNFTGRENNEWLEGDAFEFKLSIDVNDPDTNAAYTAGNIILPDNADSLIVKAANKDTVAFGDITFKAPGTYKFIVTETVPEEADRIPGVIYDASPSRTVTVEVTDAGHDGQEMVAQIVKDDSDELVFNNRYDTTSTELIGETSLEVTKDLTGRDWLDTDSFTFTLKADPDEEDQTTQNAIDKEIVKLPGNASGLTIGADTEGYKAAFGNITFTEPGTYQFVVAEQHAGETINGITYDDAVKHVIVNVTDNKDGTLSAELDENSDALEFKNTYDTQSTTLNGEENLEVTKNFTGRPDNKWLDGDKFSFSIAAKDQTTQDAVNNNIVKMPASSVITVDKDNRTAAFGDITFTEPGTYTFTVKEEPGKISGVAYDKSEKTVTVEVKDNKDGTLKAQIVKAATDELTFSNTYDTTSTELNGETSLTVTKDFTGRENGWLEDDAFTFTLAADPDDQTTVKAVDDKTVVLPDNADGLTITGENKDHQASFGNITFTEPGTYKFVVSEVEGDILGVNYDDAEKHVTVVVSDKNDGTLEAKLDSENSSALTFTNTYTTKDAKLSGEANLKVTKVLEGRDWFEDDSFTFKLETGDKLTEKAVDAGDIVLPDTELTISSDTGEHTNAFEDITFKKTGDYTFTVSEVKGNIANVAYDSHKAVVNVHVTDNNEGSLVASVTPTTEGSLTFTNTYSPTPVTAAFAGTKVMSGRDLKDTDTFTFTVNKGEGMPEDTPMPAVTTAQNDADGKIAFAPITFKEAGTYEYVITETGGSVPGVTNDSGVEYAEVKVTYDPATGILTPDVTYSKEGGNGGEGFTFTNVYSTSPTDTVTGFDAVKTVTPSDGNSYQIQGGEFAFSITPSVNNPDSDPVREKTVTNDADGNVQLASGVQYTEAGTYSYTVKEETGSAAGMSYDDSVYVITVTVTDDQGTGKLVSSTAVTKDGKPVDGIAFDNGYNPQQTSAVLGGKKNLEGLDLTDGAFTFSLKGVSADTAQEDMAVPMPESGKDTAQNTDAGIFQFGEIVYTVPGTYVYEISEVNQGQEGYTYDRSVYQVTVTVTDEGGQLRAQTAGLDKVVFNNSYKPAAAVLDGDAAIHGQKTLTGRDMKEGEFAFQLLDKDNNVVSETVNSADGSFRFDALTFEEAGDYYYTMVEKNTELGGITYDTTGYTVKVHVEDKGGHLEASVQYLDPEGTEVSVPDFNNQYGAKGTQAILAATKVLEGRELQAGEFSFVLKDQDGTTLSTAVNDEAGVVQFDAVSYEEAGEYTYTISEVQGDDSTITYDDTVYNVTVTVTDDSNGNLNASVDYNGADPVFTNTYKEPAAEEPAQPTEPEQPTKPEQPAEPEQPEESENSGNAPTTGDNAMRGPLTAAAVAAAGIIIAGTAVVRRRKKDNC